MTGWLASLNASIRESVFVVMRRLGAEAAEAAAESRRLSPPTGSIAVGGAHMDPLWRGHALELLLSHVRRGVSPEEAGDRVKQEVAGWVLRWNASREYQVHRTTSTCDTRIDDAVRSLLTAAKG